MRCAPRASHGPNHLGLCALQCIGGEDFDTICDDACRASQLVVSVALSDPDRPATSPKVIRITDPSTATEVDIPISSLDTSKMRGEIACSGNCSSQSISMSATGFKGLYDQPPDFYSSLLGTDIVALFDAATNGSSSSRRRALGQADTAHLRRLAESNVTGVDNPLVCLALGEGIFFDLSTGTYPQYAETSLMNTNKDFDFGEFRDLKADMSKATPPTSFYFAFGFKGTYVLHNSDNALQTTIVRVMGTGAGPHNMDYLPTRWPSSPRIVVQCAP